MTAHPRDRHAAAILRPGLVAGAAGGLAEVAWVALYSAFTGGDAADVSRAVARAASGGLVESALAGLAIHMLLGVLLGIALAAAWRRVPAALGGASRAALALVVLAGVWKVNFFIVLPLVSPAFAALLPLPVTLVSKLLFGAAAALALRRADAAP